MLVVRSFVLECQVVATTLRTLVHNIQGKSGWEKQKEEKAKKEAGKKKEEKDKRRKKGKTMEIKKVAEEWEIWDEEEEAVKSEVEAKKLVLEKFHEWIKVFGKK